MAEKRAEEAPVGEAVRSGTGRGGLAAAGRVPEGAAPAAPKLPSEPPRQGGLPAVGGSRSLLGDLVRRYSRPRELEIEQQLLDAVEDLQRCRDETELCQEVCRTLERTLRPVSVHLFLRRHRRFRLIASSDREVEPKVLLPGAFRLPGVLRQPGGPWAVEILPGLSADERRWLRSWGCHWAAPLRSPRDPTGPVGLLLYGEPVESHSEVVRDLVASLATAAAASWLALLRAEKQRVALEIGDSPWLKECPECRRCFDTEQLYCEDDDSPLEPTVLLDRRVDGKYVLEQKLGHGGMGAVYRARVRAGEGSGRAVAVKILVGGDRVALGRFANEARAGRVLRHPGITEVLDQGSLGREGGYMVMELVEGRTLRSILDSEAPIAPARVARWFDQILDAVHHAHRQGVIHRDLKPDNIMLRASEGSEKIKILDFGLAKLRDPGGGVQPTLTAAGMVIGTLSYMSPEQLAADAGLIDHRTDQFALGVMAYESLTGSLPFYSENLGQMLRAVASQPFRLEVRSRRQARVAEVLGKALAKQPAERHAHLGLFRRELLTALEGCEPFAAPGAEGGSERRKPPARSV